MKLVELSPRENYGLFLRYENGTEGVVDLLLARRPWGLSAVTGGIRPVLRFPLHATDEQKR
ncbi:MAG: hypothetical protein EBR81_14210 [Proteobacteria bacterium]|nr:hypothetical protein [Pseudomonadota bacterium]